MAFVLPAIAAIGATAASATAAAGASSVALGTVASAAGDLALGSVSAALPEIGATAASSAGWLGYAGLGMSALGGVTGVLGSIQQGEAAKSSADYNSEIARNNQTQALNNRQIAGEAGEEQGAIQEQKTRAQVGQIQANQAASGLDVNSGSPLDVRSSASELGELDALTVRSNAAKEAYGYTAQASNFGAESDLDQLEGQNAQTAGEVGAATSFLGSAGSAANNFARYQLSGGFNS